MRRLVAFLTAIFASCGLAIPAAPGDLAAAPGASTSMQVLDSLAVKGRAPKTGYSRKEFPHWNDDVNVEFGHNGCDTRNDILKRDLSDTTLKQGTHDCVVLTGLLRDPYTAREINFVRGDGTSADVQIDHVVALSNAWQTGAQQLTSEERQVFANDPLNLLAVAGPANKQKSDGDAATWLPANKEFRCEYAARQVAVKAKYRLWVTPPEKAALHRILAECPSKPS
ncbi:HNH endonuclease family protein [Corynebacterium sp. H128]|uniref:HNH endonuclease family protein n=1 Tax=unclassified Corynebacterium TaxID=2624378 RepID=UPI0030ACE0DE